MQDNGYEVTHDGKCITVFSAPNYCDTMGNKGAFITLDGGDMTPNYTTYEGIIYNQTQTECLSTQGMESNRKGGNGIES